VAQRLGGRLEALADDSRFVRLGAGVDASGRLDPERIRRAVAAIEDLNHRAATLSNRPVLAVATSAVRDASNGAELLDRIRERTGIAVQVLTGDEEAALTFRGATLEIPEKRSTLVCDLGGGSAELISGHAKRITWQESLPLGAGRLTERFVRHDPPGREEVTALSDAIRSLLRPLPKEAWDLLLLTGGTSSHVARMVGKRGDTVEVTSRELLRAQALVHTTPAAELVRMYGMTPERASVLAAGVTALVAVWEWASVPVIRITKHGLREGVILAQEDRELR